MKMEYTKPVVEKEEFSTVDIVTTSPGDTTNPGIDTGNASDD